MRTPNFAAMLVSMAVVAVAFAPPVEAQSEPPFIGDELPAVPEGKVADPDKPNPPLAANLMAQFKGEGQLPM